MAHSAHDHRGVRSSGADGNLQRGPAAGQLFHPKGRGNGYVLTLGGQRIYLSGDTECTPEMRALKNIDAVFISMNLPYTMPPSEAAECAKAFKPRIVYPYHYRLTDELVAALGASRSAAAAGGIRQ
jgi:L-ascorbate metabolism protein UlaG (beta-lactamase superfamily)